MRWLLLLVLACSVDDPPGESAACLASEDGEYDDACEGASVCSFDGSEGFSDCSSCGAKRELLTVLCDEGSDASEEELEEIQCNALS